MTNYQEQASRTCASLGSLELDLSHMIIGMVSELNELEDAINNNNIVNISEEGADFFWYLANYMKFRDYNFNNFKDLSSQYTNIEINILSYNVSKFSDLVKKFIAYKKPIDMEEEKKFLVIFCNHINNIFNNYGIVTNVALQNNIAKLKVRFPDKFNTEHALSRDLEKEHEQLKRN